MSPRFLLLFLSFTFFYLCFQGDFVHAQQSAKSDRQFEEQLKQEGFPAIVPAGNPTWKGKRGIVFDRIQVSRGDVDLHELPYRSLHRISERDVAICAAMGFDHIKLLFTSDSFMTESGEITEDGKRYIEEYVDQVLNAGLLCMICMHPEQPYKQKYLGNWDDFDTMLRFYEALGRFIAKHSHWTAEKVAFQLMSEPFANIGDWSIMNARMWNATRRGTAEHTLLLSSDEAGNIHRMMRMQPVFDSNVIYCYTTYEPYEFGFSSLVGMMNPQLDWRKVIGALPYPSDPQRVRERMEELLAHVPNEDKEKARDFVTSYGNGRFDRDWHFYRAKLVDEWASSFGGKLQVMCVEFGCFDPKNGVEQSHEVVGISNEERRLFVEDTRASFEAYGIGWCYWSYNETFTIFNPDKRLRFKTPDSVAEYRSWLDQAMLRALGLSWKNSYETRKVQLVHQWDFTQNEEKVLSPSDHSALLVGDFTMNLSEDFSIVLKIRTNSPPDYYRILLSLTEKQTPTDENNLPTESPITYFQLKLDPKSNVPVFYAPTIALNLESSRSIEVGKWSKLVLSYSKGIFRISLDGKVVAGAQRNDAIICRGKTDLVIGAWTEAFHHAAKGVEIERVEIYDGVLP